MNKLLRCGVLAALGFTGVALAQTPTTQGTPPNPAPASSPAESSAADPTSPGRTPAHGSAREATEDSRTATDTPEGTAAERAPRGQTQSARGADGDAKMGHDSKLVGAQVVTPADAPLGSVVDVVFDAKGQPAFVVIQSQSDMAAVPFAAASTMMKDDKVVMDQWRFERAPKVKKGEWRSETSGTWKSDAAKYWEKG